MHGVGSIWHVPIVVILFSYSLLLLGPKDVCVHCLSTAHRLLTRSSAKTYPSKTQLPRALLALPQNNSPVDADFAAEPEIHGKVSSPFRRSSVIAAVAGTSFLFSNNVATAAINTSNEQISRSNGFYDASLPTPTELTKLTVPLHYVPKLSAYTISYTVGKTKFGAIVDTGSPFIVVPQTSCKPDYPWGCYRPEESQSAAGLKPTKERFDGNEGWVEWRQGSFSFDVDDGDSRDSANIDATTTTAANALNSLTATSTTIAAASSLSLLFPQYYSMTFGVISESLMDGPGGIFLGLVKNTDNWIRPSFLGQSDVTAFAVDLRENEGSTKTLTLYGGMNKSSGSLIGDDKSYNRHYSFFDHKTKVASTSTTTVTKFDGLLDTRDAIPLVRDLNKKYGDPTIHYVGVASSININGINLASTSRRNGKLYVIFDTGCSGMSICPDLFDERYKTARSRKEKSLWGEVDVELETLSGDKVVLSASRPIATPLGSDRPWGKKLDGHLIVLGLAFFEGKKMTIDIDGENVWFEV